MHTGIRVPPNTEEGRMLRHVKSKGDQVPGDFLLFVVVLFATLKVEERLSSRMMSAPRQCSVGFFLPEENSSPKTLWQPKLNAIISGKIPGAVKLNAKYMPHATYTRDGKDIYTVMTITYKIIASR